MKAGEKPVSKILRALGWQVPVKCVYNTYGCESSVIAPNILEHKFDNETPDMFCVSEVTSF